jgi:hypothetical protein
MLAVIYLVWLLHVLFLVEKFQFLLSCGWQGSELSLRYAIATPQVLPRVLVQGSCLPWGAAGGLVDSLIIAFSRERIPRHSEVCDQYFVKTLKCY